MYNDPFPQEMFTSVFSLQTSLPFVAPTFSEGTDLPDGSKVLGARSEEEAEEYRKEKGIIAQVVRGRKAPKPFQTFQEILGSMPGMAMCFS